MMLYPLGHVTFISSAGLTVLDRAWVTVHAPLECHTAVLYASTPEPDEVRAGPS